MADRVGKGVRTSPRDALVADCTPSEIRGLAFGYQRAMDNAGAIIGPLIGAGLLWVFQSYFMVGVETGFRRVFALAAIPGLLVPFIIARFIQDSPPASAGEVRIPEKPGSNGGRSRPLGSVFWTYMLAVLLFTLGNSSDAFLILRANQAGLPDWQIPLLWAAFNAVRSFSSVPGGRLSDRIGRKPMILAGWIIYAASYLLFGIAGSAWQMCVILLFYGLYYGCVEGTERALVSDLVGPESRGTAFGVFHAAVGMAALPASVMFGAVWQWSGHPLPAFMMGAGLAGIAAVVLVFVRCK
jgi:MFS family permease